ncbi:hypothetical protein [Lyngbya sp. CCY1209]|jgi:hypothetical protein|uniref:hypothetical protein n=1 Tax=Lyngbya sp. CCY1209 TaxID=2886103 RepID=UPI002D211902|nr:hypothetical protein [Lyngbya sp. CCY1209]MEB3885714.1 hypothetical protein [Lyngbya sp. CCY1209]
MERGLLWLPLLAVFIGLAWSGWNEFQKVEAYKIWAEPFDQAKYDIYAVLGQKGTELTWGQPTRQGPVKLETFSLKDVQSIWLLVDNKSVDFESPPPKGKSVELEFIMREQPDPIRIPFTEIPLAAQWCEYLLKIWEPMQE